MPRGNPPYVETILASGARTATPSSVDKANLGGRGIIVVVDVTAVPGSAPSLVVTLSGIDPVSGKVWTLLASAAIVAVGTTILKVFPGGPVSANASANDQLPAQYRVAVAHGNGNSVTYSVAATVLP